MEQRFQLSMKLIAAASYEGCGGCRTPSGGQRRIILWDTEVKNFGVRIYPSGRKAFVLRYPHPHRPTQSRLMTLGEFPSLKLHKARELAHKTRSDIYQGTDPLREKALRRGLTVADFCDKYLDEYAKVRKRSWQDDKYRIEGWIKPRIGKERLIAVRRSDVHKLVNHVANRRSKTTANRVLSLLKKMFGVAEIWGDLPPGHPNPGKGIQMFREIPRDRVCTDKEIGKILKAADANEDKIVGPIIRLLLLTTLRTSELLMLPKSAVDLETGRVSVHDRKNDRTHTFMLSEEARAIFAQMFEEYPKEYWVFPGRRIGQPRTTIRSAWEQIRKDTGLADVRQHDLRRTGATWLAELGVDSLAIQRVLGHADGSAIKHYVHLTGQSTAEPLQALAQRLKRAEDKNENKEE